MIASPLNSATQTELLAVCASDDAPVGERLAALGATYEDLRYYQNAPLTLPYRTYRPLDDLPLPAATIPAVSFFSGAGGMDMAFRLATAIREQIFDGVVLPATYAVAAVQMELALEAGA